MLVPTLVIAYAVFGVTAISAQPGAASAVFEGSHLLVQLLFTPLIAGWSIRAIVDALGWRAVAGIFDRERLVTGSRG